MNIFKYLQSVLRRGPFSFNLLHIIRERCELVPCSRIYLLLITNYYYFALVLRI